MPRTPNFWTGQNLSEDRFDIAWRDHDPRMLGSLLNYAFKHRSVYTQETLCLDNRHWRNKFTPADLDTEVAALGGRKVAECLDNDGDGIISYVWPRGLIRVQLRGNGMYLTDGVGFFADAKLRAKVIDRLRTFHVKYPPQRPPPYGTNVYMLAGSQMHGYGLKNLGFENSLLREDNYDPYVLNGIKHVTAQLMAKSPNGRLALLEGPPGGGKTRAVRAMIAKMNGAARVIIVPSHMVAELSGPDLISTLIGHGSCPTVLVLEDADAALLSREAASQKDKELNTGALASILNLSDGIIGSMIDLRLLATTNAKVQEVDPAILRPGRLIARVHIDKLSTKKGVEIVLREANATQEQLTTFLASGVENIGKMSSWVHGTMTLAEAYETGLKLREWLAAQQAVVDAISQAIPATGDVLLVNGGDNVSITPPEHPMTVDDLIDGRATAAVRG